MFVEVSPHNPPCSPTASRRAMRLNLPHRRSSVPDLNPSCCRRLAAGLPASTKSPRQRNAEAARSSVLPEPSSWIGAWLRHHVQRHDGETRSPESGSAENQHGEAHFDEVNPLSLAPAPAFKGLRSIAIGAREYATVDPRDVRDKRAIAPEQWKTPRRPVVGVGEKRLRCRWLSPKVRADTARRTTAPGSRRRVTRGMPRRPECAERKTAGEGPAAQAQDREADERAGETREEQDDPHLLPAKERSDHREHLDVAQAHRFDTLHAVPDPSNGPRNRRTKCRPYDTGHDSRRQEEAEHQANDDSGIRGQCHRDGTWCGGSVGPFRWVWSTTWKGVEAMRPRRRQDARDQWERSLAHNGVWVDFMFLASLSRRGFVGLAILRLRRRCLASRLPFGTFLAAPAAFLTSLFTATP